MMTATETRHDPNGQMIDMIRVGQTRNLLRVSSSSRLEQPLLWKKPRMIFVNSMSDLFHKDIDRRFIDSVFDAMERADS